MSRILEGATPPPEKSWLRQMADRAGRPPGVRHQPKDVIGAFLNGLGDWYVTELRKAKGE